MGRISIPLSIEGKTTAELRKMRNAKSSRLNRIKAILDGKVKTLERKSFVVMYKRANELQQELTILNNLLPDKYTRMKTRLDSKTNTGYSNNNLTKHHASSHHGTHPYLREGFYQQRVNQFWERSGYSEKAKQYFREANGIIV